MITLRTKLDDVALQDQEAATRAIFTFINRMSKNIVEKIVPIEFRCGYDGDDFVQARFTVYITCLTGEGEMLLSAEMIKDRLTKLLEQQKN